MIISRTPMRISFAGGGSDLSAYYNKGYGAVISTAIDKYIYITVNKKFDDLIRVSYSQTELVESVDKIQHNIIREALKIVGIEKGIEVIYMGDIPLGSAGIGLGSSSSLAVGVLNALYAYKGQHVSAHRLAEEACKIEIDILGHPIGKQDQFIAAYGGLNFIQFNQDESVYVDPIICKNGTKTALNENLLLFYTGIERYSSEILEEQKQNTKYNLAFLDKMVKLAEEAKKCLIKNELHTFGEILHEGWLYKKKLAGGISSSRIDEYYEKALKAGAVGGKILGAGGGGFLLFYCPEDRQDNVREELTSLKETPFVFEPQGSKIIYIH
ncbi:MAG: GHMP kinase [Nitrospirae bacterium]|nr:GHMP kinase [Nitrospirota bacterium]MCL5976723.1 GHMP kinase [Nitrospirota bacterium]